MRFERGSWLGPLQADIGGCSFDTHPPTRGQRVPDCTLLFTSASQMRPSHTAGMRSLVVALVETPTEVVVGTFFSFPLVVSRSPNMSTAAVAHAPTGHPLANFDLLLSMKELQQQYGLRANDFAQYHAYLTGRIHSLRKQLKLSVTDPPSARNVSGASKAAAKAAAATGKARPFVPPKQVQLSTVGNDSRSLLLMALIAERCWAESEDAQQRHANALRSRESAGGAAGAPAGGSNCLAYAKKRLIKAVKLAQQMLDLVVLLCKQPTTVAAPGLLKEAFSYAKEMAGRCYLVHGRYEPAEDSFRATRDVFAQLYAETLMIQAVVPPVTAAQKSAFIGRLNLLQSKVVDCDDHIVLCLQRRGLDAASYQPEPLIVSDEAAAVDPSAAAASFNAVPWLGRTVTIASIRCKEALREAEAASGTPLALKFLQSVFAVSSPAAADGSGFALTAELLPVISLHPFASDGADATGGAVPEALWMTFQQQSALNKVVEAFDRAIAKVNDALDILKSEAKGAVIASGSSADSTARKTALHQLTHFLTYKLNGYHVWRAVMMALGLAARFAISRDFLTQQLDDSAAASASSGSSPVTTLTIPPTATYRRFSFSAGGASSASLSSATAFSRKDIAFNAGHLASPLDVIRMYDLAIQKAHDMLLLPGVEGNGVYGDVVEQLIQRLRCDRVYFVGHSWLTLRHDRYHTNAAAGPAAANSPATAPESSRQQALDAFAATVDLASSIERCVPATQSALVNRGRAAAVAARASTLFEVEGDIVPVGALSRVKVLQSSVVSTATSGQASRDGTAPTYAAEQPNTFAPCDGFARFPPDFQSMPSKPVFVDVAGTFLSIPTRRGAASLPEVAAATASSTPATEGAKGTAAVPTQVSAGPAATTAAPPRSESGGAADAAGKPQQGKAGWFGGWFGGRKK